MNRLKRILRIVITIPAIGAGIALVALMMITVLDVILRLSVSKAITGSIELSQLIMICAGFLGIAWAAFNDQHVKVDLFVCRMPPGVQKVLGSFNFILLIIAAAFIGYFSFTNGLDVKALGSRTQLLRVPQFPFYVVVSFSYFLLSITSLILLILSFVPGNESADDAACEYID